MKYIFSLFFSFFISAAVMGQFSSNVYWTEQTALPPSETIYYNPSRLLRWNDFKGSPDNNSVASAITASGFGYKADFKSVGSRSQLNVAVYCYFNKKNSWVKEGKTTPYILTHEQHHFDISYLAAGLFMDRLKTAGITRNNYKSLLPEIYNECVAIMNKMQNDYDSQTKNGQLRDIQLQWNERLSAKLKEVTR